MPSRTPHPTEKVAKTMINAKFLVQEKISFFPIEQYQNNFRPDG
jgi:hypothetical protein